jgi:PBP1b-binding outer membrane lipoprotein LpoB
MKHFFLLLGVTAIFFSASCSGDGAYTEEEKQEQDSTDKARQEADFEKLENQSGDTATKSELPDPTKNQQVAEPTAIKAEEAE